MDGKLLQYMRSKQKMTQKQLADAVGVSVFTISAWENGHSAPDVDDFKGIAYALGYSPAWLFERLVK